MRKKENEREKKIRGKKDAMDELMKKSKKEKMKE